jgi:hypothetical protein
MHDVPFPGLIRGASLVDIFQRPRQLTRKTSGVRLIASRSPAKRFGEQGELPHWPQYLDRLRFRQWRNGENTQGRGAAWPAE